MESHFWALGLAVWGVLLLLGLAGGDPLAAGQPGREAPAIALTKRLRQAYRRWLRPDALPAPRAARTRATESGLHAVA